MTLSDALMQYETITKEQIDCVVKTGKIKPVEELEKEKDQEEVETKTRKTKENKKKEEK